MGEETDLFWADQLADKIINRKKFHYLDQPIEKYDTFTVKTSASMSGVLHIGRLSDTIRGESVARALNDAGVKTKFIWVAEDMDPLRKVPKGVPSEYEKYLGMPVTDIPDPDGNFESYAAKHKSKYLEVIEQFISTKMHKYSMREEYKKKEFNPYIKDILAKTEEVINILNKYRRDPVPAGWSPWKPICANCGKIATPHITSFKDGIISYECKDYDFEKTKAIGCGHKADADPLKDQGKLMWKGEWAAQWAHWKVCSEGAGKEYQVPNSAFWVNGEIVEKILNYQMPEPIFYEHIMIDNEKMSASQGNVVYPYEWLEVAEPELLRFFYNKRLMKTRSFSWKELPKLNAEFDSFGKIFFGEEKPKNEKEEAQVKRLYEISSLGRPLKPLDMNFNYATILSQLFEKEEDIERVLKKTGHYNEELKDQIMDRISKARIWLEKHAPDEEKFSIQTEVPKGLDITDKQRESLHIIAERMKEKDHTEQELFHEFWQVCKEEVGISPKEFFDAGYKVLLNQTKGPKLASLIVALDKEKVIELFEQV